MTDSFYAVPHLVLRFLLLASLPSDFVALVLFDLRLGLSFAALLLLFSACPPVFSALSQVSSILPVAH